MTRLGHTLKKPKKKALRNVRGTRIVNERRSYPDATKKILGGLWTSEVRPLILAAWRLAIR